MQTPEIEAKLEEIPLPNPPPRAWLRLKAGLQAEAGRADRGVLKRWQERARSGAWDADLAAQELAQTSPLPDEDPQLMARAARLALDLWMAPTLRGASGALRGVRVASRNLLAYVLAQVLVLALFLILFAIGLLLLRYYGLELEAPLDRALGWVGLRAGQGRG